MITTAVPRGLSRFFLFVTLLLFLIAGCAEVGGESRRWKLDQDLSISYHFPQIDRDGSNLIYRWVATLTNESRDTLYFEDELVQSASPPTIYITLLDQDRFPIDSPEYLFQVMRPDVVELHYALLMPEEVPSDEIRDALLRRYNHKTNDERIDADGRLRGVINRYRMLPGAQQTLYGYTAIDDSDLERVRRSEPHASLLSLDEICSGPLFLEAEIREYSGE